MAQSQAQSRLSVRDLAKLNYVILNDFLLLVELVSYFGVPFKRTESIDQTFTLLMLSRGKSASREKETNVISCIETNSISGSACSNGNSGSFPIAALSLRWETMLLKLFSEIPESPIGGGLLLTQSFPIRNEDVSYVPTTQLMHSGNLNLSRSFDWIARSSTSLIEMSLDHIELSR